VHPRAAIAVPITATAAVDRIALRHEGTVERVKSDHLSMMQAASSGRVVMVAGTRGGFIFRGWQRGADAAAAVGGLLELLARSDAEIDSIADAVRPGEIVEAAVPCQWRHKGALMRRVLEETADLERQMVDGVRACVDDSWLWIAPDRRNALFRVQVEAENREQASEILSEWGGRLAAWRSELERTSKVDESVYTH
jgi:mannose-1-phosphate guanylyltransferase/phosphomannomutase